LSITSNSAAAVDVGGNALVSGIEVVNTTATVSTVAVNLATFGGVTTVGSVGSTAAVTYSGLNVIPTVNLTGTSASLTATLGATAVAGTADAMTINLSAVGSTADATITVNGVENITVNASNVGAILANGTSVGGVIVSDALRSLTVVGTGQTVLEANMAGAGTGTTGVTATITGSAGADVFSVRVPAAASKLSADFGAGDDVVDITQANAAQTIAGGAGTDTLIYAGAAAAATATANITGFENVIMNTAVDFALATSSLRYAGVAAAGTYTGLAAGGVVTLDDGGSLTLANTALTGTTDAVTFNVGQTTDATATGATIAAGTFDVVTVNAIASSAVLSTASAAISVSGTTLNTITLNSSQGVTLTGGGAALTTINASGVAGAFSSTATVSSTAAVTITGGAGADVITGGAFGDSLVGGAGADTITGGLGADTMTGGDGADVFVIAANTGVTAETAVSTSTVTDTIIGFTSGSDRLQLGQPVTAFVGNVANIQLGLAAMTAANQAFFVTSENTLYVVAGFGGAAGTLTNTDTIVRLPGVTALTGADLAVSATSGGTDLTISAINASSGQTGATANVGITALFTGSTSLNLTGLADTVRSTGAFLAGNGAAGGAGATLNGGNGIDTLAVTGGGTIDFSDITNFETVTLGETTVTGGTTTATVLAIVDANITAGSTLTVNASGTTTTTVNVDASAVTSAVATPRSLNITGGGSVTLVDTLIGGAGNDTISGGAGNDAITGGAGNDVLTGGDGDDTFIVVAANGTDVITGGAGNDILNLTGAIGTSLTSVSSVDLGAGVNRVVMANAADLTFASVSATGGVYGITFGTSGSMTQAQFSGAFEVTGAGGTDALTFTTNGTVNVSASTVEAFVLTSGTATTGTNAITIGATQTTITGGTGADTITVSAAGTHTLNLGTGDDVINMGAFLTTNDTIDGAGGNDTLNFTDAGGAATDIANVSNVETIVLGAAVSEFNSAQANVGATATLTINAAAATSLVFSGAAETDGGRFNITGSAGADNLTGGDGNDTISGGAAADTLVGGAGADVLNGGAGIDNISGGLGADVLTGGADADVFNYNAAAAAVSTLTNLDRIVDYRLATGENAGALDTVDLRGIGAATTAAGTVATVQDFSAQGSLGAALNLAAAGNAVDNGLVVFMFGGNTFLYVEQTGDGTGNTYNAADFLLQIDGTPFTTTTALTATGFVLG
jgi:Ca2+-binding RTX toxin-like protein